MDGADNPQRRFITEPIGDGEPSACSYCNRSVADFHFTAFSLDGRAAICCECLQKLGIISRLGLLREAYGNGKIWGELEEGIAKEIRAEPATNAMRRTAGELCLRLASRACSIVCGFKAAGHKKDPNNDVDLAPPRIALVGPMAREMGALVARGCAAYGAPVVQVAVSECRSRAIHKLVKRATMRDPLIREHAVIFVRDGFVPLLGNLGVGNPTIWAVGDAAGLPAGVEALDV